MSGIKRTLLAVAGSVLAAVGPVAVQAQTVPGPHPAYLHALTDLRTARHFLLDHWQWASVRREDDLAVREIEGAIMDIKKAAIDDGKPLDDPFPIDTRLSPRDRFRKASELLASAHRDLEHAEDVPESRGLRDRALKHIDHAQETVDNAWRTAHWQ